MLFANNEALQNSLLDGPSNLPAILVKEADMTKRADLAVRIVLGRPARAEETKAFLVKAGVPAEDITTLGKGRTDLRVETPRGVHSQENRNVHIELK